MSSLKWTMKAVYALKEGIMPPTIVDITGKIDTIGDRVALGGSCDIYRGLLKDGRVVAIKRPRVMEKDEDIMRVSSPCSGVMGAIAEIVGLVP